MLAYPRALLRQVQAVTDCPYLEPQGSRGYVVNVGRTLPDGSVRLAREIPYGSDAWVQTVAQRLGLQSTLRPRGRPRKQQTERLGGANN